jgi:hypothetical protein
MIKQPNKALVFTLTFVLALVALALTNSYCFLVILCGGWILYDANTRLHKNWYWWLIATLLFSPLVLAIYLPQRNLKKGEKREGGYVWNLAKNFSLLWTITMLACTFIGLGNAAGTMSGMTNEYQMAGAGIGMMLGLGLMFGLWLAVLVVALVIGILLKKTTIEEGPTGALAFGGMEDAR